MTESVRHRGPDDQEVWTDGLAGLVQARLAIIDLSDAANQPIASQDGSVWLTFNGEIYNFADIRDDLEALGYVFRSRGDAEVIANGWHAWGPRVFDRMRGMFALALWDRRARQLVLARDRVGKKPLYYAPTRGGVAVRLGDQGDPDVARGAAHTEPDRDRPLPQPAIRAGAGNRFRRHLPGAGGALPGRFARSRGQLARHRAGALLAVARAARRDGAG